MHFAPLTLIGFSLTTVCASICPMSMEPMPMGNGMQMMAQTMHHSEKSKDMACERCEQSGEEIAISSATTVYAPSGTLQLPNIPHAFVLFSPALPDQRGTLLSNAGPPLQGDLLVGTVVLRT